LVREIIYPTPALENLLARVFDYYQEAEDSRCHAERRREFVFHMTDWLNDLQDLQELYSRPEKADAKSASLFLHGFLIHVVPHLNAAGRLLVGEIRDPFLGEDHSS